MLRRSSSSSNIPVPRTLFHNDHSRKRSASSARLSQRSSVTSTGIPKPRERSPAEGKQTVNRLSRQTPLNNLKRGRSGSLQRTPYSDQKGRSGTRGGNNPPSSTLRSQEKVSIQKLSTNIRWVQEQYSKVQNFIATSGLFDPVFQAEYNIKPPSIKTFIHVTLVLMKQIFQNVDFNQQNYKEVITEKLKILKYPGTLALSVLKTVNTMHCWPQVIGMFGWLVDKVSLTMEPPNVNVNNLQPEDQQKYHVTQICKEFLLQRYLTFNSGNSEEKINEVNEDYQKNLAEALELQTDEYKQLSVEVEKSIETKIRMDEEIASLSEEIKALESSNEQLIKEIDDIDEKYVTEETILDGEIKFLKDKIKRIHDKQTPLIESVEQLKQTLKTQSCSHQEKLTLTKAIESLTKEVKRKREKLQHAQHLQQQFNDKLHDERNKLEEKVTRWNSFLLEWAIRKPQLKSLVLNDFGFHHQSYVDNIKEVLKQKNIIENNLIKELEELDNELKNQKALNKKMELNLQELIKAVDDLTVEYTKTHQSAEQIEALLLSLAGEWENAKKAFAQEMSEISAKYDVEGSEKTLLQSRERKESLEKEVKIFGRKVLTFFIDLHKQITKDLKEMEEIRTQVMMGKMISLRNKQLEIIKKHDRL